MRKTAGTWPKVKTININQMRISVTLLQECSVIKRVGIVLWVLAQLLPIILDASSSRVLERTRILKDVTQQKIYAIHISNLCQMKLMLQNKGGRNIIVSTLFFCL